MKKKKKAKSLSSIKKKAWGIFSQYIRRSSANDYGLCECYTCGTLAHWKHMQAGHGIGGRTNAVLFDQEIVRVQCVACNIYKSGNYTIFTTKLIKENGMEWWEKKLQDSHKIVKHTRADLEEKIRYYSERLNG